MRQAGFSLLELLVVVLVATITLFAGIPALENFTLDARRTADINAFVTSIQLARSESAKLGLPVVVCKSGTLTSCGGAGTHYEAGWLVFVNTDGDIPAERDPSEPILFSYSPQIAGTIRSNRARYSFRPYFRRSTNGTVTFCDRRGEHRARAVIVSYTGRPRVAGQSPDGSALTCTG